LFFHFIIEAMQTEILTKLTIVFNEIFSLERNHGTFQIWDETIKNIHPKSCDTRESWVTGKEISFDCKFTKNGSGNVLEEIVKGIQNKTEVLHFLYGLNPDVFHFNPESKIETDEYIFIRFILRKSNTD